MSKLFKVDTSRSMTLVQVIIFTLNVKEVINNLKVRF